MTGAFPPPSRFSIVKMAKWIEAGISSKALVVPGRMPEMPNRVVGVTSLQGPGMAFDTLFDTVSFRIDCRGAENNLEDAENIANEVDDLILNAPDGFYIGGEVTGVWCNNVGRTGGGPAMLRSLPDPRSRYEFVCTYFAQVSTNVGQVN